MRGAERRDDGAELDYSGTKCGYDGAEFGGHEEKTEVML